VRGYLAVYRLWTRWCEAQGADPEDASPADIARWLQARQPIAPSTVHNAIVSLRAYYRYLVWTSRRPDDPTAHFRIPKVYLPPVQPYNKKDIDSLLGACRKPRDRAMLLLLMGTGLRASELAAIRERDIDWREGLIEIQGKGGKHRLVAPGPDALDALKAYLDNRAVNIWGFEGYWGVRMWLDRLAKRAGVTANPHRFRHSFACSFFEATECEGSLQLLLGHEGLAMAHHYAEAVRGKVALRQQQRFNAGSALEPAGSASRVKELQGMDRRAA
jgi:site-specific recombinase XerD